MRLFLILALVLMAGGCADKQAIVTDASPDSLGTEKTITIQEGIQDVPDDKSTVPGKVQEAEVTDTEVEQEEYSNLQTSQDTFDILDETLKLVK